MKKLIVANWKMNVPNLRPWRNLRAPKNVEVVVCPPFPFLLKVKSEKLKVKLGAQDVFWETKGAYTGEVSPTMLKDLGVEYVILGHSERRVWLGETDEMINKKVLAALKVGLKVILCVGEPSSVRRKGITAAKKFVRDQLKKNLRGIGNWKLKIENCVTIAYEPIWAISTSRSGKMETPSDAAEMIRFIKKTLYPKPYTLNPRVLYGGSVNARSVKSYLDMEDIDGALVGGASLSAKEFAAIITTASNVVD